MALNDTGLARGLRRFALDQRLTCNLGQTRGEARRAARMTSLADRRRHSGPIAQQRAGDQYRTGMRVPPRLVICLLVPAVSLVSGCGCGSAKKASTTITANTNVGTSAPAGVSAVPKATNTKEGQHSNNAVTPSAAQPGQSEAAAAEENRRREQKREANIRAAGTQILGAAEADLPLNRRYPKELQGKFLRACERAKGSSSSCECIIARQEANLKVETGQSLAELLALELAFEREHATLEAIRRKRVPSPRLVRRAVIKCR
jgi:hypothetical protein